jgi:hypothetical protein
VVVLLFWNLAWAPKSQQERITFHRGANFTLRLVFNGLERSIIIEKSIKVSFVQEASLEDKFISLACLFSSNLDDSIFS